MRRNRSRLYSARQVPQCVGSALQLFPLSVRQPARIPHSPRIADLARAVSNGLAKCDAAFERRIVKVLCSLERFDTKGFTMRNPRQTCARSLPFAWPCKQFRRPAEVTDEFGATLRAGAQSTCCRRALSGAIQLCGNIVTQLPR